MEKFMNPSGKEMFSKVKYLLIFFYLKGRKTYRRKIHDFCKER